MKGKPLYLFLFFLMSALLSGFCLLVRAVPAFKFSDRSFRPSPAAFALLTAAIFAVLLGLWKAYAPVVSRLCGRRLPGSLEQDFQTYLPLLFLSLTPLTLRHYIGSGDLLARLRLFAIAVAAAVIYLKAVELKRWAGSGAPRGPSWGRKFAALSLKKKIAVLFVGAVVVFNAGALLLVSEGANFSGDEPHYLLIAHSLLKDGDFELSNNYEHRDYHTFMNSEGKIAAHVVPGARPGSRYSFHSPGVAFLMLPFYALGLLLKGHGLPLLVRLGMSLWGAFLSIQVYLYARREWPQEGLALKLWCLTSFTTPVFFYSIHIYPEIMVAGLSLAALRILRFSQPLNWRKGALCGLLLGSFFWFHALKYIALFVPLFLYGFWTLLKKSPSRSSLLVYALAAGAVIFAYLGFQHALYGTYSLSTVSWAAQMTDTSQEFVRFAKSLLFGISWRDRWRTLAGYFFDQRDGLLLYSPIFFFAFFGAVEMVRRRKKDFWLLLGVTAPYVLVSAFLTQRAGYAPQARPLVSVIWGLAIWLGFFLARNRKTVFSYFFDVSSALSFLFVFLLLKSPLYLHQETTRGTLERGGGLFFSLSNLHFRLTDLLPSYINSIEGPWLPNLVWPALTAVFIGAYLISKKKPLTLKPAATVLLACGGVTIFFVGIVLYPRLALRQPAGMTFGPGKTVTFYSLSRAATMTGPGRFEIREDGRSYRFYMTTERPIEELRIAIGSTEGAYDYSIRLFDETLARGRTAGALEGVRIPNPAPYKLGGRSFYTVVLDLGKGQGTRPDLHPFVFALTF